MNHQFLANPTLNANAFANHLLVLNQEDLQSLNSFYLADTEGFLQDATPLQDLFEEEEEDVVELQNLAGGKSLSYFASSAYLK